MNKKGHVMNGVLLSIGLGYILEPSGTEATFVTILEVGLPVTLGALFPDVDTEFGKHRKTLHNLPVLGLFVAFPYVFGNLEFVWIGVLTHYVLDVMGSKRGIALFYPYPQEFGLPVGVAVKSKHADLMTVVITGFELVVVAAIVFYTPWDTLELGGSIQQGIQALGV
ncbi:metal-dependent hydrolase [Haloarchaeobius iranensis]|uniref:LexA-binding, inner membrane-associated putative hydrolase n=1 Tax=Haloarchaeobius iranensis TaxID=996166 RepID=A0A1G9WVR1_9EURY|nr:metal-dependent hydrolase [Haloarchaeobius iranensis]SDM88592.1 LexA-binding, inner membrane-associated putative hydrolase [Haloarchaeobius iranensis]